MSKLTLRFFFRCGFVLALALAFVAETSCDDEGSSRDLGLANDGGGVLSPIDAQAAGDSQADPPMSTMRIAHLAPGIGPIDFCYQGAKKGTFVGPVLGGAPPKSADAGDGGDADAALVGNTGTDASLDAATPSPAKDAGDDGGDAGDESPGPASYRTVSKYQNLKAAGPITIAILEAGATSCANTLATVDVTLDPGKLSTVAVFGRHADGGIALSIAAFTDDRTTSPDKIRVRVVHAALGKADVPGAGPLAVRAVAAKTIVLTDHVEPRHVGAASEPVMVDALGYVTAAPIPAPASIAIGPATIGGGADAGFDPWQSKSADLDLYGGSLHTAFVLSGASDATFEVLWCSDSTTAGSQTACQLVR